MRIGTGRSVSPTFLNVTMTSPSEFPRPSPGADRNTSNRPGLPLVTTNPPLIVPAMVWLLTTETVPLLAMGGVVDLVTLRAHAYKKKTDGNFGGYVEEDVPDSILASADDVLGLALSATAGAPLADVSNGVFRM